MTMGTSFKNGQRVFLRITLSNVYAWMAVASHRKGQIHMQEEFIVAQPAERLAQMATIQDNKREARF